MTHPAPAADHRARARAAHKRLVRAASNARRVPGSCPADDLTLVAAGVLARAAQLAAAAGELPAGLDGDAALGWRAARDAIVQALAGAADHQGARVPTGPPPPPRPRQTAVVPPATIDWSQDRP
ncbi:hypothetical protein ACWERV_22930 [Streptomyces sp. NPDC004031]